MKKITRFFAILLAFISMFSLTACSPAGGGTNADDDKSLLYIRYYNAGFGNRWLLAAEQRFEEMYENISFEENKVGVDIILDPSDSKSDFMNDMKTQRDYIYFAESFDMTSYYSADVMEDLTDALTTPLNQSYGQDIYGNPLPGYAGETKSIYQKMSTQEKEYYSITNGNDVKLYAVPYIDCYNGTISYDVEDFNKYKLYFNENNVIGASKANGDKLGLGPDGVANTADDGLPRTYDEFFQVCTRLKNAADKFPFVWCGNYAGYTTELANNLFLQNAGSDFIAGMLNGQGTIPDYITGKVTSASNYTYTYNTTSETFTSSTFDKCYSSASVFNATDFMYRLIKEKYEDETKCFTGTYLNTTAQKDFFFGYNTFMVDGTWWFNEAENHISNYEKQNAQNGKDRYNRDVQYMALPKADLETYNRTIGENIVGSKYITACVVKKGLSPAQKLLAETFVRFYCTDESLAEFNTIVSTPRGLEYTLTETQYNALTPYAKSLYNIKTGQNGFNTYKVTYLRSGSQFYKENISIFDNGMFESQTSLGTFVSIANAFKDRIKDGLNSIKYFEGILSAHD